MYEVSDNDGEVIALIDEKECFSFNRAKLLFMAGYRPDDIAIIFNVTTQRVEETLGFVARSSDIDIFPLPLTSGCKCITRFGIATTPFFLERNLKSGRNKWLKENAVRLAEIQHDEFRVFQYESLSPENMTPSQQAQLSHYLFDDFSQVINEQTII